MTIPSGYGTCAIGSDGDIDKVMFDSARRNKVSDKGNEETVNGLEHKGCC